jgi:TetR/AcrR family transcriptional regulator
VNARRKLEQTQEVDKDAYFGGVLVFTLALISTLCMPESNRLKATFVVIMHTSKRTTTHQLKSKFEAAAVAVDHTESATDIEHTASVPSSLRKRPKPGERRVQILKMLAHMLEQPYADRITTAALAAKLEVSEAALYRHFATKAQMFEALIEFIEQSVFGLIQQTLESENSLQSQAHKVLKVLLQFGDKNPGMVRVMVGDALIFENERLLARMNQFFENFELQLCRSLQGITKESTSNSFALNTIAQASVMTAFAVGRLQRYTRSGFKRRPIEHLDMAFQMFAPPH